MHEPPISRRDLTVELLDVRVGEGDAALGDVGGAVGGPEDVAELGRHRC